MQTFHPLAFANGCVTFMAPWINGKPQNFLNPAMTLISFLPLGQASQTSCAMIWQ